MTTGKKTEREEFAEAKRAEAEATARTAALRANLRGSDLATVKELIAEHGFKVSELRPELKSDSVTSAKKVAKKTAKK